MSATVGKRVEVVEIDGESDRKTEAKAQAKKEKTSRKKKPPTHR